jgi:hypothetical protein
MNRSGLMTATAVLVIVLGIIVAVWINSHSLVSGTVQAADGTVVDFRIYERDGTIYASADRRFGGGTIAFLADSEALKEGPASIDWNEKQQVVMLRAGKRVIRFDLKSQQMGAPSTEQ